MLNHRALLDPVHLHRDRVDLTAGGDLDLPGLPVQDEGPGDDGLERTGVGLAKRCRKARSHPQS